MLLYGHLEVAMARPSVPNSFALVEVVRHLRLAATALEPSQRRELFLAVVALCLIRESCALLRSRWFALALLIFLK